MHMALAPSVIARLTVKANMHASPFMAPPYWPMCPLDESWNITPRVRRGCKPSPARGSWTVNQRSWTERRTCAPLQRERALGLQDRDPGLRRGYARGGSARRCRCALLRGSWYPLDASGWICVASATAGMTGLHALRVLSHRTKECGESGATMACPAERMRQRSRCTLRSRKLRP